MKQHVVIQGPSGPTSAGWHQVADAMRCMKEYQYRYVRKIYEPTNRTPDAFAVGSCVHAGRARWFARAFRTDAATWQSVKEAVQEEIEAHELPVTKDAEHRALVILEQFIQFWSARPLPRPIATEYLLGPAPLEAGERDPVLWRTSKPDDISEYPEGGKGLWLGDCKTTSGEITDCIREYELHGQFLLMMLLYRTAPQGLETLGPINGVMLDIIKKPYGKQKAKFSRYAVKITESSLAWFTRNLRPYLRAMNMLDWNSDAPRNVTQCTRMAGRQRIDCEFKKLCNHGRTASSLYVYGEGESLKSFKPNDGRKVEPWT